MSENLRSARKSNPLRPASSRVGVLVTYLVTTVLVGLCIFAVPAAVMGCLMFRSELRHESLEFLSFVLVTFIATGFWLYYVNRRK